MAYFSRRYGDGRATHAQIATSRPGGRRRSVTPWGARRPARAYDLDGRRGSRGWSRDSELSRTMLAALPVALLLPFVGALALVVRAGGPSPRVSSSAAFAVLASLTLFALVALTRLRRPRAGVLAACHALAWAPFLAACAWQSIDEAIVSRPMRGCGTGLMAFVMLVVPVGAVVLLVLGTAAGTLFFVAVPIARSAPARSSRRGSRSWPSRSRRYAWRVLIRIRTLRRSSRSPSFALEQRRRSPDAPTDTTEPRPRPIAYRTMEEEKSTRRAWTACSPGSTSPRRSTPRTGSAWPCAFASITATTSASSTRRTCSTATSTRFARAPARRSRSRRRRSQTTSLRRLAGRRARVSAA